MNQFIHPSSKKNLNIKSVLRRTNHACLQLNQSVRSTKTPVYDVDVSYGYSKEDVNQKIATIRATFCLQLL